MATQPDKAPSDKTIDTKLLLKTLQAVRKGDFSVRMPEDRTGTPGKIYDTLNEVIVLNESLAREVARLSQVVGREGRISQRAAIPNATGDWRGCIDALNSLITDLGQPITEVARVMGAVAKGDLTQTMALDVEDRPLKGELLRTARVINGTVAQLSSFASEVATAVAKGDLTRGICVEAQGQMAALKDNINQMLANLRDTTRKNTEQDWLKTNLTRITRMIQGQRELETVSRLILRELAPLVQAQHGVFFLMDGTDKNQTLRLLSSYAYRERKSLANHFRLGEGLVGQCALEKERILLTDVPNDYIRINSGLGDHPPLNIVVLPVIFEGAVKAVLELASFQRFNETHLSFLDQLAESIGIVLHTIAASMRTEELLAQSQSLASELRGQQQELTETNHRLEQQARSRQASEERLKQQQEELQQTNEELEERSRLLQMQNMEVERKNREIEQAKESLEDRAQQLALSSRYKNEFLANMSHELRTPLNSLLILSKLLSENAEGNLSGRQVEFAQTIHGAGSDLLSLINDILDLSKIESGTMSVDVDEVSLTSLKDFVERTFRQMAVDKKLGFNLEFAQALPPQLFTDGRRLQQVIKNLLANAFKFTDEGHVTLDVRPARGGWSTDHPTLNQGGSVLAFSVIDTGIGIAENKQKIIFEAFQQADGTTSRKYGGTGLGLSISREIARLLGGEIKVVSAPGKGSTFTLYVPQTYISPSSQSRSLQAGTPASGSTAVNNPNAVRANREERVHALRAEVESAAQDVELAREEEVEDDRRDIESGDRTLLIIEDDIVFARILLGLAREKGFKGLVALRGDTGLAMARQYKPDAITLDLGLPVIDGWSLLDRLKHDGRTRHIPVHIISASEEERSRGLRLGALAVLRKPVTREALGEALGRVKDFIERPVKNLLVVEDDARQRESIVHLIGNGDVKTTAVGSGHEALASLGEKYFDCVVLDLGLPDMTGLQLADAMKAQGHTPPIIVYTGQALTEEQEIVLKRVTDAIIIKSVKSPEQLLDETALFLHRVEANLPESKRAMIKQVHQNDPVLAGKKVLVVDDDVRNIFALTSVLERHKMQVLYAENGRKGIELIRNTPDLHVVLMDVMMPEMDGYETMRAIRQVNSLKSLPIIALTAKAMKGDREKCIDAGASDYITKPVETDQLISLLRVWLFRTTERHLNG
ncbi:response regulator [Melittangium boletus]|uniref:histidine kinase n=1 Tax=Melittangium boletus DSM 14713 TaxID=1294270 RepID=A0A250I8L0_9BACT|nr:response regulator [Melittangium boletus]ATB27501.1 hybrid sensor histidine kinase/response regulator [Melittangium boletus DSM 14713]